MKKKNDEITITSNIENLTIVQNFVEEICDLYNIPNHFGILSIALEEAVTDAIVHGNNSDDTKMVNISCVKCYGGFRVAVTSEGNGFDQAPDSDLCEEGRNGIFLMRSLCNQLKFQNDGKTVELIFFIEGIDSAKAIERAAVMMNFYQSGNHESTIKQQEFKHQQKRD